MKQTRRQFLAKIFPFKIFEKKVPKNTTWLVEEQKQKRRAALEVLAVVSMIPVFYFMAVLLLSL